MPWDCFPVLAHYQCAFHSPDIKRSRACMYGLSTSRASHWVDLIGGEREGGGADTGARAKRARDSRDSRLLQVNTAVNQVYKII